MPILLWSDLLIKHIALFADLTNSKLTSDFLKQRYFFSLISKLS